MSETAPRHASDITTHPDATEMRERFAKVVGGNGASALDGLIILLGLYLAISPWVVHSTDSDLRVHNLVIGLTLAAFGFGLALQPERLYRLAWITIPIGVWLIVSPWVVSADNSAPSSVIWNNVCVGILAILFGLAAQGMTVGATRGMGMRTKRTARASARTDL